MSTKLVVVGNYRRPEEAHVARLKLEQAGLLVFVQDEDYDTTAAAWPADGVKVLVPEDQVAVATRMLDHPDDPQP